MNLGMVFRFDNPRTIYAGGLHLGCARDCYIYRLLAVYAF